MTINNNNNNNSIQLHNLKKLRSFVKNNDHCLTFKLSVYMSGLFSLLSYTVESQYTVQWCNKGPHRPHCAGILAGPVRDQDVIYIYIPIPVQYNIIYAQYAPNAVNDTLDKFFGGFCYWRVGSHEPLNCFFYTMQLPFFV